MEFGKEDTTPVNVIVTGHTAKLDGQNVHHTVVIGGKIRKPGDKAIVPMHEAQNMVRRGLVKIVA
jgi:hypothetical protein